VINIDLVDFSKSRVLALRRLGVLPQFSTSEGFPIKEANQYFISQCGKWSPNTIRTYSEHLVAFLHWISNSNTDLSDCTDQTIAVFADSLCQYRNNKEGLSWNTIDRRIRVAASFLRWCSINELVKISPSSLDVVRRGVRGTFQRAAHPAKPIKTQTRFVDISMALRLITLIEEASGKHSVRNGLIARLMLEVGLRISEALSFSIEALPILNENRNFSIAKIIGKGRKERAIAIPSTLLRALHTYSDTERRRVVETLPRRRRITATSLFLTASGLPPSRGWIEKLFIAASLPIGRNITPHMLRHTFGTYHYHLHKDLPLLRQLMGHSHLETTEMFYVHTAVLSGYSAEFSKLMDRLNKDE
jgi:integrase/recombinase XerD